MAKKKSTKKRRSSKKFQLPLALVAPIGLLATKTVRQGDPEAAMNHLTGALTGYRPDWKERGWKPWHFERLKEGSVPILLGAVVHKVATKVGINRALSSAGVPWIRI